jgi:hypothetical protein
MAGGQVLSTRVLALQRVVRSQRSEPVAPTVLQKNRSRAASKADSHRRWLSKPANREHFRGPANVERVRQWREANPGYWKSAKTPLR